MHVQLDKSRTPPEIIHLAFSKIYATPIFFRISLKLSLDTRK